MKLSLGPIQYFWPRDTIYEFYDLMLDLPIDIVYLGETVCAKRRTMKLQDWLSIASTLTSSGKQVVLSTLTLIEAISELNSVRRICRQADYLIEANDMAAVQILSNKGIGFVAGPFINIYNARSLAMLYKLGLKRWVVPVELSQETLNLILTDSNFDLSGDVLETELFCYGKLPLAYSARCFTARSHNLQKDDCQFVCMDYPDGLDVISQDKKTVFTMNGIQTQSGITCDLSYDIAQIINTGVDILRISPQLKNIPTVIHAFRNALDNSSLDISCDDQHCNGYWHNKAGFMSCS
ncbi:MAG: U32 family peptidase [Thiohalomonadales bacterium]